MASNMGNENTEIEDIQIHFRAGRKRKAYRHRADSAEHRPDDPIPANKTAPARNEAIVDASASESRSTHLEDAEDAGSDVEVSLAQVLRLRNSRKLKVGGVAFSAECGRTRGSGPPDYTVDHAGGTELVLHNDGISQNQKAEGGLAAIPKRFAPQTGVVGELVNRHMEEYVEAELARRKKQTAAVAAQQVAPGGHGWLAARPELAPMMTVGVATNLQPAMRGKIQEIDLGDEVAERNAFKTERAMRKLQGDDDDDFGDDEEAQARPKKVRLGKPSRPRNRRASEDIKRDELVEQFLRENKLDVYDLESPQTAIDLGDNDEEGAADDRFADQFRRDFFENMQQRRRRKAKPPATNPRPGAKPTEEILKGPKLGGSRNSRQQMRDLLLKEQEKKR